MSDECTCGHEFDDHDDDGLCELCDRGWLDSWTCTGYEPDQDVRGEVA